MAETQLADNSVATQLIPCRVCSSDKPLSEFYPAQVRKDRSCGECKDCSRERVRANRVSKAEYYKNYDKQRFQSDPRVKERIARYQASDAGKESMAKSRAKWESNNPKKRAAQVKLGNAIRDGKITRENQCRLCGEHGDSLDAHHFDYTKPLEVTWLCRGCHSAFHRTHGPMGEAPKSKAEQPNGAA